MKSLAALAMVVGLLPGCTATCATIGGLSARAENHSAREHHRTGKRSVTASVIGGAVVGFAIDAVVFAAVRAHAKPGDLIMVDVR